MPSTPEPSESSASKPSKKRAAKASASGEGLTYATSGVNIEAGNEFVDFIEERVADTYSDRVVKLKDGFGGMFAMFNSKQFSTKYRQPILVSGTDGVGTKLKLAFALNKHDTIGIDLVAMCVNDILCLGAEPAFFLDYFATGKLEPGTSQAVIKGVIDGCMEAGCALLGGETAEMPGMYQPGEYDLAGFAVGIVENGRQITGERITPGDMVIGLPSSGPHANGYSLIRAALMPDGSTDALKKKPKELGGRTIGEALLEPTRIYAKSIGEMLAAPGSMVDKVLGIAHITGGGICENIERILPYGCHAVISKKRWERPAIFDVIQQAGGIADEEMERVFNLGIGMAIIARYETANYVMALLKAAGESPVLIGQILRCTPEHRWVHIVE